MVKIPKFNELKKMGEGLASSAKNSKIFDKIKTSVDSLGAGGMASEDSHGDAKTPLEHCVKLIHELQEIKRMEANLFNSLKAELTQMAKDAAAESGETAEPESESEAKEETAVKSEPVVEEEKPEAPVAEEPQATQVKPPEEEK